MARPGENLDVTGIVLDDAGHVVTRSSAIDGAEEIWVACGSGPAMKASVVATDPVSDVAVLKLPAPDGVALWSAPSPELGGRVVAVHHAGSGDPRVRSAVVGSTGLNILRADGVMQGDVFVADADDFESSGDGVLFDTAGRFVGLAVALPTTGRGLAAVDGDDTVAVAQELLQKGHVEHPWLGINGTDLGRDLADAAGVAGGAVVTSIAQDGPAAVGGDARR